MIVEQTTVFAMMLQIFSSSALQRRQSRMFCKSYACSAQSMKAAARREAYLGPYNSAKVTSINMAIQLLMAHEFTRLA